MCIPGERAGLLQDHRRSASGLLLDERGAVLVLGIFMATGMVGVLWYLAGVGDAIVFRERMQESADAAAFSAAVLHARGMNLIVLLNLLMASILGLRVAMKAIQSGLAVAGVIALLVPFAGQAAAEVCFQAASQMQNAIDDTREPINRSIAALSKFQDVIKSVAPGAAIAGSVQVGEKYEPLVSVSAAASLGSVTSLPVEYDSPERLCRAAGESVASVIQWLLHLPVNQKMFDKANDLIGKSVERGGLYFCEMGLGSPPDFSKEIEGAVAEGCGEEEKALQESSAKAEREYLAACALYAAPCGGGKSTPTPAQHAELTTLEQTFRAQRSALNRFDRRRCERQKKASAERQRKELTEPPALPSGVPVDRMRPMKIQTGFANGNRLGQVLALTEGRTQLLQPGERGVRVGALNDFTQVNTPAAAPLAFAQAEFFFDCRGLWNGADCDAKSSESMWHLRWRARLRRYAGGSQPALAHLGRILAGATALSRGLKGISSRRSATPGNAVLLGQLSRALQDPIIH